MGARVKDPSTGQFKEIYVKALDSLPVGASVEYAGTTIPDELKGTWLFERGQELSRTEYAKLFSIIGTSYGVGDGSTTFNLPNKCGRVPVGLDENDTDFNTIGKTGGSKYLEQHYHDGIKWYNTSLSADGGSGAHYMNMSVNSGSGSTVSEFHTGNVNSSTQTGNSGNLQPYIVKNYIIKVKETRPLASHTVNAYSESESNAYSCDYANKAFGGKVLWTNPSPSNDFGAQIVSLDLTNYDAIEIIYYTEVAAPTWKYKMSTGKLNITNGDYILLGGYIMISGATQAPQFFGRQVTVSSTGLTFGSGKLYNGSSFTDRNSSGIPLYIIGYKTGLFPTQQSTRSLNTYSGDIEEKKDIVVDDGNDENNK